MKFRLLHCFVFAVACIVGTCCVPVLADDEETCVEGQYLDNAECKDCPLAGTNAENNVGSDKRFYFIKYGNDEGIGGCAVKLNPSKDSCADATEVVYVYDVTQENYIRKVSNVVPLSTSVVNNEPPATDVMRDEKKFCTPCGTDTPYNMGGVCVACDKPRYYLKVIDTVCYFLPSSGSSVCNDKYMCSTCPAGYYCPGKTENDDTSQKAILCPENTYSEGGAGQCTSCPMGYFTDENNNNGLCEAGGKGCVSRDACKFKMSKLCINGNSSGCFTLDENKVNVESVNRSVVQTINQ